MGGLHPTQPASVRIGAVRAVFGFCDHLKTTGDVQLLAPYLDNILEGLVTVATQFSAEVLGLCLETLSVVVTVMCWIGVLNCPGGGVGVGGAVLGWFPRGPQANGVIVIGEAVLEGLKKKGPRGEGGHCYRRSSVSRV